MSVLTIKIRDASVAEREIRGKNGSFTVREQVGWVEFPSGEVRRVKVNLPRHGDAYKVGTYAIGVGSFQVNQFESLELGRQLELVPVASAAVAPVSPSRSAS